MSTESPPSTNAAARAAERRIPAAGFGLCVVLWSAFAAALLLEPGRVGELWDGFRDLSIVGQIAGWVLLLPWVLAALVWQAGWALWLRLVVIALLALFTMAAFSPKQAAAPAATPSPQPSRPDD